jgi:flavin-dependent dehydrogenase
MLTPRAGDVVIVGGGIAGSALVLIVSRHSVSLAVRERQRNQKLQGGHVAVRWCTQVVWERVIPSCMINLAYA